MAYMTLYHEESQDIVNLMQNRDPFFDYLTAKIMTYIPEGSHGKRILDLGCGGGRNSVAAAKKGYHVIGIDYVEKSLIVARNYAKQHHVENKIIFKKGDITQLDPKMYGKFDYIILQEVIEHVKDYQSLINFCYFSLKKGGKILITTPHDPKQWNKLDEYARHERRFTLSQIKFALKQFSSIEVYTLGFPFHRIVLTLYSKLLSSAGKSHKAKWFRQTNFIHKAYYYLGSLLLAIDDHFNSLPFGTTILAVAQKD